MSKYKINLPNHLSIQDWKEVAEEKQKYYYEFLGKRKWELYEPNDLRYLKLKIGYALFGPPLNLQDKDIERAYREPLYKKKIDYIMYAIKKMNINVLYVSFVYFIAIVENKYTEFPVLRVLKKREEGRDVCFFIDPLGYTYKSWEKLLYTNVMPSCIYCYPRSGYYTCDDLGQVELDFGYSPQSYSIFSKGIGVVSAVGSVMTGVLPGGSTMGKPIMAESVVRGVSKTTEKCWITVGSFDNCSSVYAVHSTHLIVSSSQDFETITHFIAKVLDRGPMRTNWFAVLNKMPEILKFTNRVSYTHIAQLFVTILFFCHTIVSYDAIKQILKETFNEINNNKLVKPNYRQMLFLQETNDKLGKKGNDEVVRLIKQIETKDKLLEEIVDKTSLKNYEDNGNYAIENLLEVLKAVTCTNNRLDIITNYCLFLEEVGRNCKNCNEKIKEARKYVQLKEEICTNDELNNSEDPDLDSSKIQSESDYLNSSELDNYQNISFDTTTSEIVDCNTVEKAKESSGVVEQGTTQAFLEFVELEMEPMEYYERFVSKAIVNKPVQHYSDSTEANTWFFVLPEENSELKLIKINVMSVENDLKCVKVSYY